MKLPKHEFRRIRIAHLPRAVVVVSSAGRDGRIGAATISWVGVLSSRPTIIGVSFLPDSYTRACIVESREFVVNVPDATMVAPTNYLGSVSGPWEVKMKGMKKALKKSLTLHSSKLIKAPRIEEYYLNFECRVLNSVQIGLYDCFLGEVLTMWCNKALYRADHSRGRLDTSRFSPLFCIGDEYWTSGKRLGVSTENKRHFHGPQH